MNAALNQLQPYPFVKLAALLAEPSQSSRSPMWLTIGEPQHPVPDFVADIAAQHISLLGKYPGTAGSLSLRENIANWLSTRYVIPAQAINPEKHLLSASGTREALFGIAQAVVNRSEKAAQPPVVILPNPCYQIYEGAAIISGAQPYYLPTTAEYGYLPNYREIPEDIWARTQLLYYCSPGNPVGVFHDADTIAFLVEQAQKHDFVLVADECYSEIYRDEQKSPAGLLETAYQIGVTDFHNCIAMNSLSKRSNLPGLRSGFISGDVQVLQTFLQLRTYQGNAMSPLAQEISSAAWQDESHVLTNRARYREKFAIAERLFSGLPWQAPLAQIEGGFFLWLPTIIDDEAFTQNLYHAQNLKVLAGSYLGRESDGETQATNPAAGFIRVALVSSEEETEQALIRLVDFFQSIHNS